MKIGIFGLIFALLFVFKIAGIGGMAAVSWWVVFAPLYIPLLLCTIIWGLIAAGWAIITKR